MTTRLSSIRNISRRSVPTRWLLLACCALLLVLAGLRPLAVPDEGRYADIGRWMLVSGDWLTPRLNGVPFFHKPAFLYWLEAASLAVLGVNNLAARLIPALHAALMLFGLYFAAQQFASKSIARRSALMLASSLAFLVGGQYVNHDMLVAAWISSAVWCFALALNHAETSSDGTPHAWLARAGFVACAFGVLSKGLIGVALPGMVLFFWVLATGQLRRVWSLPWLSGLALFCVIALPWFVLAQRAFPDMLGYMFGTQQFSRYTGTTFNNARPWWFYGVCLLLLMFPWAFFAIKSLALSIQYKLSAPLSIARSWLLLALIWLLSIVLFFSIPTSKIVGYMLPVMPPLALLAALGWEHSFRAKPWEGKAFYAVWGAALLVAVGVNVAAARHSLRESSADIAALLACMAAPGDLIYAVGDYPYDLPFITQSTKPMVLIQDWEGERKIARDNWRREIFEGANFEPASATVLQTPEDLEEVEGRRGVWVVAPQRFEITAFKFVHLGSAWTLYQSFPTADAQAAATQASLAKSPASTKSPQSSEQKGLPGCRNLRHD